MIDGKRRSGSYLRSMLQPGLLLLPAPMHFPKIQNLSAFSVEAVLSIAAVMVEDAVVRAVASIGAAVVREKRIGRMVMRVWNCILKVGWWIG